MNKNRVLGLFFALLVPIFMMAQDPHVNVSAKSQVMVGERFNVAFEVNAEGKDFKAPSFNGFSLISGPMTSRSTSMKSINGSTTVTVSNKYTYVLLAEKEGDFTIGAASVMVDGNLVKSDPYSIKVVAGNGSAASTTQGGQPLSGQQQTATNDPKVSGQDLFLKAIPTKKTPYIGEPIVLTYKLYTRVPLSITAAPKMPSLTGFWIKECQSQGQSSETVNGVPYDTYEVYKTVLIPQKSGSFTIEPMVLECMAQVVTQNNNNPWGYDPFGFFNDPFFTRSITNVPKTLQTPAVNLEVKSLPEKDKPDSFNGAVGNYTFTASVDKNELNTNEAFVLTLTLSGSGNIELVDLPEPVFPSDFDASDPIVTSSVNVNGQGMKGDIKAEYTVIPRHAGEFTIPPMEFSFFNASKEKYEILTSQAMEFKVNKGSDEADDGGLYAANQGDIKRLGSDIRHIHTGRSRWNSVNTHFFASTFFFIILVGMLLAFLLALFMVKKRRQYKQDVVLVRNKRATKVARGRLKNAYKYLKANDQNHFYEEMSQALWGYISDKLSIERSVLSMETVKGAMMDKGIEDALSDEFVDTLNTCEFARFAPGDAAAKMQELYSRGMQTIMKVEKAV